MRKICLIKQPAGLGDIFFCQKIAKTIQANTEYKHIIWPVSSVYSYLEHYMGGDGIYFCDEENEFEYKEIYHSNQLNLTKTETLLYVPLETAGYLMKTCKCHQDLYAQGPMKYDFCKISHVDWIDYFTFKRDKAREERLVEKLSLDLSTPYNLINNHYGTFPYFQCRNDLKPQNQHRNIRMDFYEGTTLFDWIKIFENATEIHSMDTSVIYLLNYLGLENVYVYSRHEGHNYPCFTTLFNKKWVFFK